MSYFERGGDVSGGRGHCALLPYCLGCGGSTGNVVAWTGKRTCIVAIA